MRYSASLRWLMLLATISGCTAQKPPVLPSPVSPKPNAQRRSDSLVAPLKSGLMIYEPGDAAYVFQSRSIVQSVLGDSVPRVDSSRVNAILRANYVSRPQSRFIRATVVSDSVTLANFGGTTGTGALPNQSYALDIDPMNGKATIARSAPSCSQNTVEGPFRGDEVVPAIPSTIATVSWPDTSVYSICRGGVLLRVTRVSNYQRDTAAFNAVTAVTGALARVVRTTEILVTGSGSQWEQPVEASGRGTAIDTLLISIIRPRLQTLSGTSQLELNFKSALRSQRFTQATITLITTKPNAR